MLLDYYYESVVLSYLNPVPRISQSLVNHRLPFGKARGWRGGALPAPSKLEPAQEPGSRSHVVLVADAGKAEHHPVELDRAESTIGWLFM